MIKTFIPLLTTTAGSLDMENIHSCSESSPVRLMQFSWWLWAPGDISWIFLSRDLTRRRQATTAQAPPFCPRGWCWWPLRRGLRWLLPWHRQRRRGDRPPPVGEDGPWCFWSGWTDFSPSVGAHSGSGSGSSGGTDGSKKTLLFPLCYHLAPEP